MLFRFSSLRLTALLPLLLVLLTLGLAMPGHAQNSKSDKLAAKTTEAPASKSAEAPTPSPIVLPVINLQGLIPQTDATEELEIPPEPSFGTHLLDWLAENSSTITKIFNSDTPGPTQWQALGKWQQQQLSVPRLLERWQSLADYSWQILLWGLGGALGLHFLLLPLRRSLRPKKFLRFLPRLGMGLVEFGIGLLPVVFFMVVALSVLDTAADAQPRVRLVLQGMIYAIIAARLILLAGRLVLAPSQDNLRLLPLGTGQAKHLYRWLRIVTLITLGGGWLLETAGYLEMPEAARRTFTHLLGLVLLICLILLVQRNRAPVSRWLRGETTSHSGDLLGWARQNLGTHWHRLTITYLLIGYTVTMLSPSGTGFAALLRGTLVTVLIFLLLNVLLYGLRQLSLRAARAQERQERLPLHQPILLGLLRIIITGGSLYLILLGWNVDFSAWLKTELAQRLIGASLSISIAIISAVLCYEILCSVLNSAQQRQSGSDGIAVNGIDKIARVKTLLPLIRHSVAVLLTAAVILIGLSELGINIAPLLAGAGILGVAVGFGSQALVKDFITGLFIIIEDTIHVGDVVTCDTHSGVVESMTIRTLRLRDVNGALHVLPYSVVTGFINQTRGFAFAVMDVGVAYDTDLRRAFEVLREVGAQLQRDPELGQNILAAAEIDGVQGFADSAIMLRIRIKTLPGQQWKIRFAALLAIKDAFDAAKITIPFPTVTHQFAGETPSIGQIVAQPPRTSLGTEQA